VDPTGAQAVAGLEDSTPLESVFTLHYGRVARTIALVTGDPSQAEELAVEVFLRWSRHQADRSVNPEGWLYRTAANLAIDELRKHQRRARLEKFIRRFQRQPTPEDIHSSNQERYRVRDVLSRLHPRQAELLVLRTQGLSYNELATALGLNAASVGTLLSRAQRTFRKEYIAKYGSQ